ncbi:hypothetical protein H257_07313 [Aphanomyces astaci]|uniref:Uncharacterized protein n=1 Tax=Aphanomyces astaci TaxID=112090 RepID=W4GJQ3_APHAT|nr:hypothetical protein H257_07313 [Aphanomyces astaci]ETV79249.1 hypothetical protein H257_07313 [Aphanomyces astaci]|eukprot:XP_009831090.1 hypothetical protein H257_07313 [Aphanomyces astaci]
MGLARLLADRARMVTTRPDLSFVLDGNKGWYALWPKKALDKFRHIGCPRTCTKSLWKAQSDIVA